MENSTKEEVIIMLQEMIGNYSGDCAIEDGGEFQKGYMQILSNLFQTKNKHDGKCTEEQLKNYVECVTQAGIKDELKKFLMYKNTISERMNKTLATQLERGILNYEQCGEIMKDMKLEYTKLCNDANIEYFGGLKEQGDLSFEQYMQEGKKQISRFTQLLIDQYNNRFKEIANSHVDKSAGLVYLHTGKPVGKALPPKKEGYKYYHQDFLKEQSSGLYAKYGDFIDGKVERPTKGTDYTMEYFYARSRMLGELNDLTGSIQVLPRDDKNFHKSEKMNQKSVNNTEKNLSSIEDDYDKKMRKIDKKVRKQEKVEQRRNKGDVQKSEESYSIPSQSEKEEMSNNYEQNMNVGSGEHIVNKQEQENSPVAQMSKDYEDMQKYAEKIAQARSKQNETMSNSLNVAWNDIKKYTDIQEQNAKLRAQIAENKRADKGDFRDVAVSSIHEKSEVYGDIKKEIEEKNRQKQENKKTEDKNRE